MILKERELLQARRDAQGRQRKTHGNTPSKEDRGFVKHDLTIKAKPSAQTIPAAAPSLPATLEKAALIIVDAQKGFGSSGELPVARAEEIVPVLNELMELFPVVVATQDWHPADHVSFAINHADKKIGDTLPLGSYEQPLFPMHCIENTRGSQFLDNLNIEKFNRIFKKGTDPDVDCFSGFFDCEGGKATDMDEYLKENGIEHIFVAGLATNYCVKETALDGLKLGFEVTLIEDACRGIDKVGLRVKTAIQDLKNAGVGFVESKNLKYPARQ
ncbi:MAG TPA: bifunctional nicotinamidase/pyrazinamidase [Candidatus Melainabacteria bacterium]|nr:bifunctional nicotinamidase/pyrazinamidase [Candidatus Melainabacteria bacterium]